MGTGMARPIWTGSISFGLVTLPVKLYSAIEDQGVHFHNFERDTGERVRNKRVAEGSGKEVAYEDVVKGYEVEPGQYVMVEKEELESVEPGRSRAIEIEDFIELTDVDPVYFDKTYHVVPADEGAARPYALLVRTLQDVGRVGIARFVMRGKQYLGAIRTQEDGMVLETMHFPDEVRDAGDLDEMEAVSGVEVSDRELAAAKQLVDTLTSEWDPTKYEDTYRQQVLELLQRKAEGEDIVVEAREEEPSNVVDLMAALEASIERAKGGKAPSGGSGGDRLEQMSKEELYEEAQRRDIDGRSKMTKDQLIDALQQQAS
jgi:DNA end-binding protein Ku